MKRRKRNTKKKHPKDHRFKFRGRYERKINNGLIFLPKIYVTYLNGRIINLITAKRGILILIPGDKSLKGVIEEKIRKLKSIQPEIQFSYLTIVRLKRENRLYIPSNIRKSVGLNTHEVIVVGCGNHIEIWDRNAWEREMRKTDGE